MSKSEKTAMAVSGCITAVGIGVQLIWPSKVIGWWLLGLGLIGLVLVVLWHTGWLRFGRPTATDLTRFQSDQIETISNKRFTNEVVVIDGKSFYQCSFHNVTLLFHGVARYDFVLPAFTGSLNLESDNQAVLAFMELAEGLKTLPTVTHVQIGLKDQRSGAVKLSSTMVRGTTQEQEGEK
jgi:hypothetical protein